ncbi:MAG: TldD/PmbA family protein [Promethearchaeota archaeon]
MEQISLERNDLEFLRDIANKQGLQYFNIRFASGQTNLFSLLNGISKSSNSGIGKGFSVQAYKNGGWGLAVGKEFTKASIERIFNKASKLANFSSKFSKGNYEINPTSNNTIFHKIKQKIPLQSISLDEKMRFLLEIEKSAHIDSKIVSTHINYSDGESEKISYNNFDQYVRRKESGLLLNMQVIAKQNGKQEGYFLNKGGLGGYEILQKSQNIASETAKNALELLNAKPAKPGKFDIIMDPSLSGTFVHEAFGHAAEADGVIAGESILADKMNKKIGEDIVTIIDDGSIEDQFGFTPFDDEGIKGQKNVIVKDGILVGFMHNLETASKMGVKPTGNARAMNISSSPLVRMTNMYLKPGNSTLDEMIQEIKNGLLCVGWTYGYCEITGQFMFKMAKAYMIENGEKTHIIRDAAISGLTLSVLKRITMLSKDYEMDPGHCGKEGQSVSVGSGGPHTMIKDMVIGGQ